MNQTLKELSGLVVSFLLLAVALFFGAHAVVFEAVPPPEGEGRDSFLAAFDQAFLTIMVAAAAAALTWFVLAKSAGVDRPSGAGRRTAWAVVALCLAAVAAALATVMFGRPLDGSWLAYVLLVLPALLAFYVPTALFSPASFKYSPIGASKVRRW